METIEAKLRTLLAMASRLEESLSDNDDFSPTKAKEQYTTLRDQIRFIDPNARYVLPDIAFPSGGFSNLDALRDNVLIMVSQMVAYLESKVGSENERSITSLSGPLNLLLMLEASGLTAKWALSATALSMIEVITNKKLTQLNLDSTGEFDKRLNRLKAALRPSGIEIPDLLLSGLYKVRSKVIHEGREPTSEELAQILAILDSYFRKIT